MAIQINRNDLLLGSPIRERLESTEDSDTYLIVVRTKKDTLIDLSFRPDQLLTDDADDEDDAQPVACSCGNTQLSAFFSSNQYYCTDCGAYMNKP